MHDEDGFLRKLLENPADDTVRLVYADWLDERGDDESKSKARFLRLTAASPDPASELQPLAAKLPTDWLAVVSRLKVERCAGKDNSAEPPSGMRLGMLQFFTFVCDKRWDEMVTTDDITVRRCDRCAENVHYCDTIVTARERARQGHCVAIDLGIIRREGDISSARFEMAWVGRPSAADLENERKRNEIDAVSREREERKRNK